MRDRKRYKLYDNYTTYYILVGIALMYALLAALNIWIYKKCDAVSEKIALMLVLYILLAEQGGVCPEKRYGAAADRP